MKKLIDDITNCPPVWTIRILAASILSLFSIYTAFFGVFPDMIQRSFHIGIILFLVYLMPLQNMSLEALFKSFKTYIFMILALLSLLVMFQLRLTREKSTVQDGITLALMLAVEDSKSRLPVIPSSG